MSPAVPLVDLSARVPFGLHSSLPASLGCGLTEVGHIQVEEMPRITVPGLYAADDATTPMRARWPWR
ncbi:hypothetical protein [Hymenobacter elongatus]|uniref:Uncharacterized protein n=1 Tax=Hymenobacter elongatus TaxID=877208 RepID=A0A4Z0PGV8_9BACT|nr:hypothetical protein [Hymenobacter elongatus]TGE14028.1 hypothetical protein E5J99_17745 [Hymenobacter elongatus]